MKTPTINEQTFIDIDREDLDHMEDRYYANSVYKILHLTRETIRYYEKLGLITPNKSEENNYRSFCVHDIEQLMWIDLYKKRGFSTKEVSQVLESKTPHDMLLEYKRKELQVQKEIKALKRKQKSLKQDIQFLKEVDKEVPNFSIREMPLFEVKDTVSSVASILMSEGTVLPQINWEEENYVSNLIRCVRFDEHGYIDAEVCYIKEATTEEEGKTYIGKETCLYTPVISELHDTETMGRMFLLCNAWLREYKLQPKGVVYIRPRILMLGDASTMYLDCWVPIFS